MTRKRRNARSKQTRPPEPRQKFSVQIPAGDFYGELKFVRVPIVPGSDSDAELETLRDGSHGQYQVTYVLTTPGTGLIGGTSPEKITETGDSLLEFPPGLPGIAIEFFNGAAHVEARCYPNRRRRLAKIQTSFAASSRAEAEKTASDLILPMLSWLTYRYDVPLDVKACEVLEISTNVVGYAINVHGRPRQIQVGEEWTSKEAFRAVLSSYREAMSSTNVFYQALCYYKVIEGCYRLRDDRRKSALDAGAQWSQPNERIPDGQDGLPEFAKSQAEVLQPYFDKKFTAIRDDLRNVVRNALAHLDPFGEALIIDKFDDADKCRKTIPVLRFMSRVLINNEIAAFSEPTPD